MTNCPHCRAAISADADVCARCGQRLANAGPSDHDETVHANISWASVPGRDAGVRRAVALTELFAGRPRVVIGRSAEADIYLPHSTVSRFHAELEQQAGGLQIRDRHSVNGVLLNGQRIQDSSPFRNEDRIGIGPYLFHLDGDRLEIIDNSRSLRLQARNLEKIIRALDGKPKRLLENISLVVEPGEFVSLLGPSGSGKSTLMDCLNGRRPATSGLLLANGENFYQHYDSFRQTLGYVPQKDIVHTELSVFRALYYTALLRLPGDTDSSELRSRIDEVVFQMELTAHQHTLIRHLSGGQIKRVSLAAELIARPCLLFIDEATSGLDAGTEARMMRLFRLLADEGKSVICITHNVDNVALCNLILILMRGKLVFYGPPQEALPFFRVSRVSEIYDRLQDREPAAWEQAYQESSLCQAFVHKRLAATERMQEWRVAERPPQALRERERSGAFTPLLNAVSAMSAPRAFIQSHTSQLWVLIRRNLELLWRDRATLRLLALQAPLIGLFIVLGFSHTNYEQRILAPRRVTDKEKEALRIIHDAAATAYKSHEPEIRPLDPDDKVKNYVDMIQDAVNADSPLVPDRFIVNPMPTYTLLFLLVIIVLWFGCSNSAKEIIKEDAIYQRERAVNLGILPYLSSKFVVLSAITAFQALALMLIVFGGLELLHLLFGSSRPHAEYVLSYPAQFGMLVLLGMTGVALGLLLSAFVRNPDQANTLIPYVLIPQVILGGGMLPVKTGLLLFAAMVLSPAYWAFRATRTGETTLPADFPVRMTYDDTLWLPCAVLLIQTVALFLATLLLLRRKDARAE